MTPITPWKQISSEDITEMYNSRATTWMTDLDELKESRDFYYLGLPNPYFLNPFSGIYNPMVNLKPHIYGSDFELIKTSAVIDMGLGYSLKFQERYERIWMYQTESNQSTFRLLITEKW